MEAVTCYYTLIIKLLNTGVNIGRKNAMEFHDYSNRRGALVQFLSKMHEIMKENAEQDKQGNIEPPEHIITWTQKKRKELTDITRRFYVAQDGGDGSILAGFIFCRIDGGKAYIEEVQLARAYRNNPLVLDGLLKKLEFEPLIKDAEFFASERVKANADEEMLAAKGFKAEREDGFEKLGTFAQASAALRIRYSRGAGA